MVADEARCNGILYDKCYRLGRGARHRKRVVADEVRCNGIFYDKCYRLGRGARHRKRVVADEARRNGIVYDKCYRLDRGARHRKECLRPKPVVTGLSMTNVTDWVGVPGTPPQEAPSKPAH